VVDFSVRTAYVYLRLTVLRVTRRRPSDVIILIILTVAAAAAAATSGLSYREQVMQPSRPLSVHL